jgi:phosphohistidine phosphatase
MKLYLMRHGDAEPKDPLKYFNDADRPLTKEGKHAIKAIVDSLNKKGFRFDLILTSPYLRVLQTAEIMAKINSPKIEIETLLEPGFNLDDLRDILKESKDLNSLLLVGHAPDLGNIIGELIGKAPLDMKKGSMVEIEINPLTLYIKKDPRTFTSGGP